MTPLNPKLVSAEKLLESMFDKSARPSLVWLKKQRDEGRIPFCKIGRKVFFDPALVYQSMFPGVNSPPSAHLEPAKAAGLTAL